MGKDFMQVFTIGDSLNNLIVTIPRCPIRSSFLCAVGSNPRAVAQEEEALLDTAHRGPIRLRWVEQLLTEQQSRALAKICDEILQEDPNSSVIPEIIGMRSHISPDDSE